MFRLAIIADDLTGALDSAEPFARAGLALAVATSAEAARELPFATCDVLAVNVDSRRLEPDPAARAIAHAWQHFDHWRPDYVLKKIDSRMKGNVGIELAALLEASGRAHAIVAPAIPAIGRFTNNGAVTGFGVEQPISIVALPGWQKDWEVPDCDTTASMAGIANRILASCETTIAVGASGLAEAMAAALAPAPARRGPAVALPDSAGTRMLMAIGSRDPITQEQIARLAQSDIRYSVIEGDEELPFASPPAELVLLRPAPAQREPDTVANELAGRALRLARQQDIAAIFLSGGDTASAFIRQADIGLLTPLGSLAQGMPIAQGLASDGTAFTLVTKSGGFGPPDALVDAIRNWQGPV